MQGAEQQGRASGRAGQQGAGGAGVRVPVCGVSQHVLKTNTTPLRFESKFAARRWLRKGEDMRPSFTCHPMLKNKVKPGTRKPKQEHRMQQWKSAPQVFDLHVSSRRLDLVHLVFFHMSPHIASFVCFVLPAFMLGANFANKSDKLLIKQTTTCLPAVTQSFARHAFGRFRNQLASRTQCSNKVESGTKSQEFGSVLLSARTE